MIIALVTYKMPPKLPLADVERRCAESAQRFRQLPGLVRKNYLYDPATGTGGGSYLWETRAAAEAYYDAAWFERMTAMLGNTPTVQYFESPLQVDNAAGSITTG
ncbi:MAG: YdhR family protein [Betaproteobacteria bacterium]|nr:YdhR family protein [Betaproteobacteria bacterium]